MLVDAVLVTEEFETDRQPYTRLYVLDSRWILKVEHYNYKFDPDDREYNFEDLDEARERIVLYMNSLDSPERTIHSRGDRLSNDEDRHVGRPLGDRIQQETALETRTPAGRPRARHATDPQCPQGSRPRQRRGIPPRA